MPGLIEGHYGGRLGSELESDMARLNAARQAEYLGEAGPEVIFGLQHYLSVKWAGHRFQGERPDPRPGHQPYNASGIIRGVLAERNAFKVEAAAQNIDETRNVTPRYPYMGPAQYVVERVHSEFPDRVTILPWISGGGMTAADPVKLEVTRFVYHSRQPAAAF